MDTQKIGRFLKELRKENNMTQEQLGERIGVTNKTVSRWETGNYMPPIECLKLLSDIYQISINEILSGEKLDDEKYKEAAEENITTALESMEADEKRFENNMIILMVITALLAITIMILLPNGEGLSAADKIKEIIVCVLVGAMAFISNFVNFIAVALRKNNFRGKNL